MTSHPRIGQEVAGRIMPAASIAEFVSVPFWKRALDVACVLLIGPFLVLLLAVTAFLVKVTSRGPVFYKQTRIGLLGQPFTLFKFCTMRPGSDTGVHEAYVADLIKSNGPMTKLDAKGDPRLTPCGRTLRASGLDELPQLINVLRGEMSLVGPRPCLPAEYENYLPWQRERFRCLPGLTGLWQVSGKNRMTFSEMVELDIQYARTKSLWLDLKILLKTIPVLMNEVKGIWASAASAK